jgi:hypothetical protein
VHFVLLGAMLFLLHRILVGDPRVVVMGRGLRADLERRFRDLQGRAPTPAELAAAVEDWQRDEVLFREALRQRLDRDEPNVRAFLADRVRGRTLQELPKREPTEEELEAWLVQHRELYERPLTYEVEWVAFAKREASAAAQREAYTDALAAGKPPATLGRPIMGVTLTAPDLAERFGARLAQAMRELPPGAWRPLEHDDALLLVRLNQIAGGLPSRESVRASLIVDWRAFMEKQALLRAIDALMARYRFTEGS